MFVFVIVLPLRVSQWKCVHPRVWSYELSIHSQNCPAPSHFPGTFSWLEYSMCPSQFPSRCPRRYSTSLHTRYSIWTLTVCAASNIRPGSVTRSWTGFGRHNLQRKKLNGVISGEFGGQDIGPPRPIHVPGKCLSTISRIPLDQCWNTVAAYAVGVW